jgi:hypothetical protein
MGEQGCKDWAVLHVRAAQSGDLDDVIDLWTREGGPTRHAGGKAEARTLLARDPEALLVAVVDPDNSGAIAFWQSIGYELDRDARWSRLGT